MTVSRDELVSGLRALGVGAHRRGDHRARSDVGHRLGDRRRADRGRGDPAGHRPELDSDDALGYGALNMPVDPFEAITRYVLGRGVGASGEVGAASSHLLPARPVLDHAVAWMESRLGERRPFADAARSVSRSGE